MAHTLSLPVVPPRLIPVLRYGVAGVIALSAEMAVLAGLVSILGLHYLAGASLAFLVGLITNYAISVAWVFNVRTVTDRRKEFLIFTAVGLAGLVLNAGLLFVMVDMLNLHYLPAKGVAAVLIFFFNFVLRQYFLFSRSHNARHA